MPLPRVDVRPRRIAAERPALGSRAGVRQDGARARARLRGRVGAVRVRQPGHRRPRRSPTHLGELPEHLAAGGIDVDALRFHAAGRVGRVRVQLEDLRRELPRVLPLRGRPPEPRRRCSTSRRTPTRLEARGRLASQFGPPNGGDGVVRATARSSAGPVPPAVPRHGRQRDAREAEPLDRPGRAARPGADVPVPRLLRRPGRRRGVARRLPRARRPGRRRGPRARRERPARRRERRPRGGDAAARVGAADRLVPVARRRGAGDGSPRATAGPGPAQVDVRTNPSDGDRSPSRPRRVCSTASSRGSSSTPASSSSPRTSACRCSSGSSSRRSSRRTSTSSSWCASRACSSWTRRTSPVRSVDGLGAGQALDAIRERVVGADRAPGPALEARPRARRSPSAGHRDRDDRRLLRARAGEARQVLRARDLSRSSRRSPSAPASRSRTSRGSRSRSA